MGNKWKPWELALIGETMAPSLVDTWQPVIGRTAHARNLIGPACIRTANGRALSFAENIF